MLTATSSMVRSSRPGLGRNERRSRSFTCKEWEELRCDRDGLTQAEAHRLHVLAERAARRLNTAVLARTAEGLKAGQVVGVLAAPGCTLEILPKIDGPTIDGVGAVRAALIRMLAVAEGLPIAEGELAALDTQRHDLLELLIGLFANRLLAAVRRGLPRRYVAHEEDLRLLRGRLDVKRQTTHLAVRPDRLACRFDELSENTPLNRVLKAAVARLAGLARSLANLRLLTELSSRFEAVAVSPDPLREPVRLDRTNDAFHTLHRLARLFLRRDWQSTAGGHAEGFALLFPMNDLFEKFIARSLQRALNLPVHLQPRRHSALVDEGGGKLFQLRPDAVIDAPGGAIVLDTKWKRLRPEDSEHKHGVKQKDVYQMLTYATAWKAKRLILLYPWHEGLQRQPPDIERRWRVAADGRPFDVATIDVGRPRKVVETLRAIVARE